LNTSGFNRNSNFKTKKKGGNVSGPCRGGKPGRPRRDFQLAFKKKEIEGREGPWRARRAWPTWPSGHARTRGVVLSRDARTDTRGGREGGQGRPGAHLRVTGSPATAGQGGGVPALPRGGSAASPSASAALPGGDFLADFLGHGDGGELRRYCRVKEGTVRTRRG
jgi:hypothetical protein